MSGWGGLAKFSAALSKAKDVPRQVAQEIKSEVQDDLASNFDRECDPYGKKWTKRVTEPKDGHPILYETGALYRSRKVSVNGKGDLLVEYRDKKAAWHQDGTEKMVARPVVPTKDDGLPPKWKQFTQDAFKRALERLFNNL